MLCFLEESLLLFFYCIVPLRKDYSVDSRCRLCTGDLLPFIFLLFRKFLSDWHSVFKYIYGDFCADRCIVLIVTFSFTEYEVQWHATAAAAVFLKGGIKRKNLAKGSTTTQTLVEGRWCSTTSAFPLHTEGILCHKNQRLLWQIRFFWKKNNVVLPFCGVVIKLFGSFLRLAVLLWFWSSFWGWEMGREANREGGGDCVTTRFLVGFL